MMLPSLSKHLFSCKLRLGTRKLLFSSIRKWRRARSCFPRSIAIVSYVALGTTGMIVTSRFFSEMPQMCRCEAFTRVLNPVDQKLEKKNIKEECSGPTPHFSWTQFWKLLLVEAHFFIGAVIAAFIVSYLNVHIPLYLGTVVNRLNEVTINSQNSEFTVSFSTYLQNVREPMIKLLSFYTLQSVLTSVYVSMLSYMGENMASSMRRELFRSYLIQPTEFFDRYRSGDLITRLSSDVQDFKSSFKLSVSQGLRSFAQILGNVITMLSISPCLTLGMVVTVPCMVAIGTLFGHRLRYWSSLAQEQNSLAVVASEEAIENMRTVKAFALEEYMVDTYHSEVDRACQRYKQLGIGIGCFQGLSNFALNNLVLAILGFGGYYVSSRQLTPGDLMAFLITSQSLQKCLAQLSNLFGNVVRGYSSATRVFEFLPDTQPHVDDFSKRYSGLIPPASSFRNKNLHLQFCGVDFSYPSRKEQKVLQNFWLDLPPGKVIALCGPSGSGKSTIVSLIERFYDVQGGCILLNGQPITDFNKRWLRQKLVGLINQEPQLFHGTVRENIRFGRLGATDEEVEEAAKLAYAHDFISEFPQGYDTPVGQRGIALSGGQKQRIAIARAILKDPVLLVLDEATSALDAHSEKSVQKALDTVMKGRTVLIVAHRLSTIKNADVIVVLQNGKVLETGNHHSLMKQKGHYRSLVHLQTGQETL